jgi:mevalonate kinase
MPSQPCVCASAPGKVILFGEHAVVYGKQAIAASLSDLRIWVKVTPNDTRQLRVQMPDLPSPMDVMFDSSELQLPSTLHEPPTKGDADLLQEILRSAVPYCPKSARPMGAMLDLHVTAMVPLLYLILRLASDILKNGLDIEVRSQDLPVGAGLGSSAAFGVACSAALLPFARGSSLSIKLPPIGRPNSDQLEIIRTYSFYSEILLHGTPSGIDNAVSTFGGAIDYTKKKDGTTTMEQFCTSFKLEMILANTHVPRSTKAMVAKVRESFEKYPAIIEAILTCIGNIANQFRQISFKDQDQQYDCGTEIEQVLSLIRLNQQMLQALGVSHGSLNRISEIVADVAGCDDAAVKLTGAGGGGCAMILLKPDDKCKALAKMIQNKLESRSYSKPWRFSCLLSSVGQEGVLWMKPDIFPSVSDDNRRRRLDTKKMQTVTTIISIVGIVVISYFNIARKK